MLPPATLLFPDYLTLIFSSSVFLSTPPRCQNCSLDPLPILYALNSHLLRLMDLSTGRQMNLTHPFLPSCFTLLSSPPTAFPLSSHLLRYPYLGSS